MPERIQDVLEDVEFEDHNSASPFDNILFYSPKMSENIDDKEVLSAVYALFPALSACANEKDERKMFIEALLDIDKIELILMRYNYSMQDFIKVFYRRMPYLFSSKTYIDKIRSIVEDNYADD